MKIKIHFESFKSYSDISFGISLLEILISEGLYIDKINHSEPIKYEYSKDDFLKLWNNGKQSILFKGNNSIKFIGSIDWFTHAHPNSKIRCMESTTLKSWKNVNILIMLRQEAVVRGMCLVV